MLHGQSLDRAYENEEYREYRLDMWWEEQQRRFDRLKRQCQYEEWLEQEYTKGEPFTDDDLPF